MGYKKYSELSDKEKQTMKDYQKKALKSYGIRVPKAFMEEFTRAVEILDTSKNSVFVNAMKETIDKAKEKENEFRK